MKYKIVLIVYLVAVLYGETILSQDTIIVRGSIKDKISHEPVPFATLSFINKNIGLTANDDGQFSLPILSEDCSDSILISSLGFDKKKIAVNKLVKNDNDVIYIKPIKYAIEGVVVKPLTANEIINEIVEKYHQVIRKSPYAAKVYFKEKAKKNNQYIMYTDLQGYLISFGYNAKIPLDIFSFFCENMRKSDRKDEWLEYLKYYNNLERRHDLLPGYNSLLNAFRRFELYGPLSLKEKKKFTYTLDRLPDDNHILCLKFKSKNKKNIYSGKIFYDKYFGQLYKIEIDSAEIFSEALRKVVIGKLLINYTSIDNQLFIESLVGSYSMEGLNHFYKMQVLIQKTDELNLTDEEYSVLFVNDINPEVQYNETEWSYHQIEQDDDFDKINKDLTNEKRDLSVQFIENEGKPYCKEFESRRLPKATRKLINKKISKYFL